MEGTSILFLYYVAVLATLICQCKGLYYDGEESPLELKLTSRDIGLQIGEKRAFSIINTTTFDHFFPQDVTSTLVFSYSVPIQDQIYINPLPNVTINGTDFEPILITVEAKNAGRLRVSSKLEPSVSNYTGDDLFFRVSVYKYPSLIVICQVVGWIYFVAWSISFYPQIVQNYRRKSVRGLSFEFVFLNITGFLVYSIYNVGLFWIKPIQDEYYTEDPTGTIPVQINDVVFSLHAVFASGLTGIQCLIYDRGSQTISYSGRSLICGIAAFLFIILVVTVSNAISWLMFLEYCSYVKLFITLIKYVPQAYLNYTRKSTSGWSIGNVLLDFTGGAFSMVQMLLFAFNHDDWYEVFGDFTKFGLGLFSITFDIFFIVQHYVLYRNHLEYEPIEGNPDPILNPHEDMTTSNHLQSSCDETCTNPMPHSTSVDSLEGPSPPVPQGYQESI